MKTRERLVQKIKNAKREAFIFLDTKKNVYKVRVFNVNDNSLYSVLTNQTVDEVLWNAHQELIVE